MPELAWPRLSLVAAPAVEPLSLPEAKQHLRLPPGPSDEDPLIESLIVAARAVAESETGCQLVTATWDAMWWGFPASYLWRTETGLWTAPPLMLPRPPLQAVLSVSYVDPAGATQVWPSQNYLVGSPSAGRDGPALPGWVYPVPGTPWPLARAQPDAVTVRFRAGYGDTGAQVPSAVRQAMLLLVGEWYTAREASGPERHPLPIGVQALLGRYARITEAVR